MTNWNKSKKITEKLNVKSIKSLLSPRNFKKKLQITKSSTALGIKKVSTKINRNNIIISLLTIITIVAVTICYFQSTNETIKTVEKTKTINKAGVLSKGTPTYKTLLPAGKTIAQLGGWTRVSPSNVDPVYAFVDKIDGIPINLSQQPLPKELQEGTDEQIANLASDFRAKETLTVGNTTVYIGTSAKGPQSVIFTKNNLLILIKSSVQISNDKWWAYIDSLQ